MDEQYQVPSRAGYGGAAFDNERFLADLQPISTEELDTYYADRDIVENFHEEDDDCSMEEYMQRDDISDY